MNYHRQYMARLKRLHQPMKIYFDDYLPYTDVLSGIFEMKINSNIRHWYGYPDSSKKYWMGTFIHKRV